MFPKRHLDTEFVYSTRTSREQRKSARNVPQYHCCFGWRRVVPVPVSRRSRFLTCTASAVLSLSLIGAPCSQSRTNTKHSGRPGRVQVGIDVLEAEKFAPLRGKHVGLITNHTGLDSQGRSTVDLLSHAPGVQLVALFSPEHGLAGRNEDERIASTKDAATGLPIYSLYVETRRPTDSMLQGIDTLVFDVQDAGVRFYTYLDRKST